MALDWTYMHNHADQEQKCHWTLQKNEQTPIFLNNWTAYKLLGSCRSHMDVLLGEVTDNGKYWICSLVAYLKNVRQSSDRVSATSCRLMCQRLYRRVLQSCDSSDLSGARCPKPCSSRWSYRWLCHASTMATRHLQGFLPTSTNVCSRSSMLPPVWFIVRLDTTTSRRYCATCTG